MSISKARLARAYAQGWNSGRKCTGSHIYGLGHLPAPIEAEYDRGYADATKKGLTIG